MKIDNFTTARCKQCGWMKQFQPGKEYSTEEFRCDCKEEVKPKAKSKPMKQTLIDTIKGASDGKADSDSTTKADK